MKLKSLISALIVLGMASCSKTEEYNGDIYAIVKGKVTDEASAPIEHIEVTIDLSKRTESKTVYTSSDGTFIFDISFKEARNIKKISITLTDTDGEENGGLFETLTEEIHLVEEESATTPMMLNLDFHCSRATL
jgi:putative lipoprotein (rSAM/lipoprotein system)